MLDYNAIDKQLTAWIDEHADEILESARDLLLVPSVKGAPAPGAPFGVETVQALECVLRIGERYGLVTRNLDGYAGDIEWRADNVPSGAEIVGLLAHVDVVPAGDGWVHPPFGAVVDGGVIYGRGAVDDKGPAIAALYAMLAAAACQVPVTRRVRLILGCDEESDFACVHHYFANEEMPVTGFTPDGRFPVIYAEKGIGRLVVHLSDPLTVGGMTLACLNAGRRSNMVPDHAEAVLMGTQAQIDGVKAALAGVPSIRIVSDAPSETAGAKVGLVAQGVSAHGSTPNEGVNAIVVLLNALVSAGYELSTAARRLHSWAADTTGGDLGIAGCDDVVGPLTSNLGIARQDAGTLTLTFNIRYPVTWSFGDLLSRIQPALDAAGARLVDSEDLAPLYVPEDDPLIATLLAVYRTESGDMRPPLTMGGGTYARVMRHGVAFGPEFDNGRGGAHQPDEHWPVEHLIRATKIYAHAVARLANS